jgi:hypothetical protein
LRLAPLLHCFIGCCNVCVCVRVVGPMSLGLGLHSLLIDTYLTGPVDYMQESPSKHCIWYG